MRVSRQQAAENRQRIVEAASRLFRERGFDGVGVDAVMKEAGLTHGGFYGHFASKDALIAEAVAKALADERAKNQTCPFDIVDCNIAPDEPCPICGDLGGINDEESGNCIAIRARATP